MESLERGEIITSYHPDTIADGLRAIVGQRNFRLIKERVEQVVTVSDDEIRAAMTLSWQTLKLTIEPSSATVVAAVGKYPALFEGRKVGAILSGGNIHPKDWVSLTRGLQDGS